MKFAVEIVARGIDYPTFRRVYYSEEFNQQVSQAAKVKERFQQEHVVLPDGKERRKVHVVPRVHMPLAVQKILNGQEIAYIETTVFDPTTRSATFDVESPAGEKVSVIGVARFIEESGGVRVHFEGEAKVKVFGIGTIAEKYIVNEVTERYRTIEKLLQQFIDGGHVLKTTPLSDRPASS
jgi:Protein of unknown function (DUF2505)